MDAIEELKAEAAALLKDYRTLQLAHFIVQWERRSEAQDKRIKQLESTQYVQHKTIEELKSRLDKAGQYVKQLEAKQNGDTTTKGTP